MLEERDKEKKNKVHTGICPSLDSQSPSCDKSSVNSFLRSGRGKTRGEAVYEGPAARRPQRFLPGNRDVCRPGDKSAVSVSLSTPLQYSVGLGRSSGADEVEIYIFRVTSPPRPAPDLTWYSDMQDVTWLPPVSRAYCFIHGRYNPGPKCFLSG